MDTEYCIVHNLGHQFHFFSYFCNKQKYLLLKMFLFILWEKYINHLKRIYIDMNKYYSRVHM